MPEIDELTVADGSEEDSEPEPVGGEEDVESESDEEPEEESDEEAPIDPGPADPVKGIEFTRVRLREEDLESSDEEIRPDLPEGLRRKKKPIGGRPAVPHSPIDS